MMDELSRFDDLVDRIAASWQGLEDKPEETPEGTVRALWCLAAGDRRCIERAAGAELAPLSNAEWIRLHELVEERIAGVPLAHLTRRQQFMGIEMLSGPEALIPRKETEVLGRAALRKLDELIVERGSAMVIDLCTGAGNLALALAHHASHCRVFGSDLAPEAVALAQRNARHLGLEDRVEFREGDLFAPFETSEFIGQVDIVVCNPPYISSAKVEAMPDEISAHEPRLAFDGGPFGINFMLRLVRDAHRFLRPDSWLCFEVGLGQGEAMGAKCAAVGHYRSVEYVRNSDGEIRTVLARTHAADTARTTARGNDDNTTQRGTGFSEA